MRISDWSSDVCSSDLLQAQIGDAPFVIQAHIYSHAAAARCGAFLHARLCIRQSTMVRDRRCQPQNVPVVERCIHSLIMPRQQVVPAALRSEEHTSELQSLMRISYAVFCLKKKKHNPHLNICHLNSTSDNTQNNSIQY